MMVIQIRLSCSGNRKPEFCLHTPPVISPLRVYNWCDPVAALAIVPTALIITIF